MKYIIFSNFLLAITIAVLAQETVDICPSRCNSDRQLSERDCQQSVTSGVCAVQPCDGGFDCSIPADSFVIANTIFEQLEVAVEYAWGPDQVDLDTSTRFLDGNVGFSCGPNTMFLAFGGDSTGSGSSESAVVNLQGAFEQGLWSGSTSIAAFAEWNGVEDQGDVTLRVFLRRKADSAIVSGTLLTATVSPGIRTSCSNTEVGTVDIVRAAQHTRITLKA